MNLSETAFWTKKATYGFIIIVILIIGIVFLITFIGKVTQIINKPGPEKAQNGYGNIVSTAIKSSLNVSNFSPSFSIETPSGKLPIFDIYNGIINVYKLQERPRDLSSDQKARAVGNKLLFKTIPTISNDIIYNWKENGANLTYNRQYSVFEYYIDNGSKISLDNTIFDINDSSTAFTNIMSVLGIDIPVTDTTLSHKVSGQYIDYDFSTKTAQRSKLGNQSPYVRLNVTRSIFAKNNNADMVDIVDNNTSIISLIIPNIKGFKQSNLIAMNYYNWNIDTNNAQTYKIIDSTTAFKQLISQKYPLISATNSKDETPVNLDALKTVNQLRVLDVKIGYYTTKDVQTFIQPIYIFTCEGTSFIGDNVNLIYYIPALP